MMPLKTSTRSLTRRWVSPASGAGKAGARYGGRGSLATVRTSKEITFVRHGESTWNAEGRIQGSSDASTLTEKGKRQAEATRALISEWEYEACLRSPLARASATADVVWKSREGASDPIDVWDLREIDLYAFEGLLKEDGKDKFGERYAKWKKDPAEFEIDGHYPVRELWERATTVWRDVLMRQPQSKLLVVAHNAVNQAMLGVAIGVGPQYFRRLLQSNCAVSKVIIDEETFEPNTGRGVSLAYFNETPKPALGKGKGTALIQAPTSIEEEGTLTEPVSQLLLGSQVKCLMHSAHGPSTRLAEKIFERCSREKEGQCPFELTVVDSVEEIMGHLKSCENDEGTAFVIHDGDMCQKFIAHSLGVENEQIFSLSPGALSIINMSGGPKGEPSLVCLNHALHLPSKEEETFEM